MNVTGAQGHALPDPQQAKGTESACFRFGEMWSLLRANFGHVGMIVLGFILANLMVSVVAGISVITICGPFVLGFAGTVWVRMVSGHLTGQLAGRLDEKTAEMGLPA